MQAMGLGIHYSSQTIVLEGYKLPMENRSKVLDPTQADTIYHMAFEPSVLKEVGINTNHPY